ncbi:dihydrofolate reductase [Paenibacillus senegalensis]|uniref:dihydrofolate reductase n=1 Tax=Paenibacillus senegalensis TaxID=1465766 RepID=UPI00028811CF|nr:dihydrofolate reductase [Paenibacillus senegalensis]
MPRWTLIAAMDKNQLIGKDNDMPWSLPKDLAYFMRTTLGYPVVSGRKNFEAMKGPLRGRRNIVLTRNQDYKCEGAEVVHSKDEAITLLNSEEEVFIIGGAEIYKMFMPDADRLLLTLIDHEFEGDTYFPEIDHSVWEMTESVPGVTDEKNPYRYEFTVWARKE